MESVASRRPARSSRAATPHERASSRTIAILEQVRARREEIADKIYAQIRSAVPEPVSDADPDHQEGLRAAILPVLDYGLEAIAGGGHSRHAVPYAAKMQARRAARSGMSLGVVIRRYLSAHRLLGEYIADEASKLGVSGDAPTMHQLRRAQETLLEQLTAVIEREYNSEREDIGRSPAKLRALTVRRLLNREPASPEELADLRYGIEDAWHVGVIADGGAAAGWTLNAITAALGCELLAIDPGGGCVWAWLGSPATISARRLDEELPRQARTHIAVGAPRRGLGGFRRTHAEALAALPVARGRAMSAIHCADVTLDAALLANPLLFKLHRETYLTPLEGLRNEGHTARATLNAYFACEQNKASTCAKLGVSRKTVENRLAQIADALDRPLHVCLPELQVALRLEELAVKQAAAHETGTHNGGGDR